MADGLEQVFIQPDGSILSKLAWLDKHRTDALLVRTGLELSASHFAAII